jgi:hypothetical protein
MLPEILKKIYTLPTPLEKNPKKKKYENSLPLKMKNKQSFSPNKTKNRKSIPPKQFPLPTTTPPYPRVPLKMNTPWIEV